jgi:RNA polymerase sigma factor (sigma-70 family)
MNPNKDEPTAYEAIAGICHVRHIRYLSQVERIVHDPDVAKDIVQDVFLNQLKKYEGNPEPVDAAWIERMQATIGASCKNAAIDHLRRKGVRQSVDIKNARSKQGTDFTLSVESEDLVKKLLKAASISPEKLLILDLYIQGHTIKEIAEKINTNPKYVSYQKYSALTELRYAILKL